MSDTDVGRPFGQRRGSTDPLGSWLSPTVESRVDNVAVDVIDDPLWRPSEDPLEPGYRALKSSIRASGILQPLLIRPAGQGRYQVVSGARRLRAARETGLSAVPAIVRDLSDLEALIGGWDAVLRVGLTIAEREEAIARLVGAGMGRSDAESLVASVAVRETPAAQVAPAPDAVAEATVAEVPEPVAEVAEPAVAHVAEAAGTEAAIVERGAVADAAVVDAAEPAVAQVAEAVTPDAGVAEEAEAVAAEVSTSVAAEAAVVEVPELADEVAGWPMAADVWSMPLADDRPPPRLPLDPVRFELGPLPPLGVASAPPAPAVEATTASSRTPAAVAPEPQVAEPTPPTPTVIPIVVPGPVPPAEATEVGPAVSAPREPGASLGAAPSPVPVSTEYRARIPLMVPEEPVPAFPVGEPQGGLAGLRSAVADPRTLATLGVAVGVGAAVFLIVAVLLGAGAGSPLVIAAVVAMLGFVVAIVSLALPRQEL